jgi:hypothetical protein
MQLGSGRVKIVCIDLGSDQPGMSSGTHAMCACSSSSISDQMHVCVGDGIYQQEDGSQQLSHEDVACAGLVAAMGGWCSTVPRGET